MPWRKRERPGEIAVEDLPTNAHKLRIGLAIAVLIAAPQLLLAVGGETMRVYDEDTAEIRDSPIWVWIVPLSLMLMVPGALSVRRALRRDPAVRMDATRLRLLRNDWNLIDRRAKVRPIKVSVKWEDVERVVIWRCRVTVLGRFSGWSPRIGVVSNRTKKVSTEGENDRDLRENGVPVWLPPKFEKRSVRLSAVKAREVAWGVRRFAPHVEVVDRRRAGGPKPID
ncbi:hypothetical protein [Salininema proteolyticum]|uniref:PH domain-containing protein n=1 Tax=Salininema proteolyticum TaxID=1607685 RepID=A0ABV8TT35_9ACTN